MLALMFDVLRDGPSHAAVGVVLAHGAGAGMESPFMHEVARGLAERGHAVLRFEFPYMQQRRLSGQPRPPDRQLALLTAYREVIAAHGGGPRLVVGGKSLGGRMASLLADEVSALGLLCFGYPFHPPKQPHKLRTAHLATLRTPTLIVQGTRDIFGTRDEVAGYALSPLVQLTWIEDGDHSLIPRRKLGHDRTSAMTQALDAASAFIHTCSTSR
jgi:predicted alpha/beta-hydrolase family hydrolase